MSVLRCERCRYYYVTPMGEPVCRRHAPQMAFRGPTCGTAWPQVWPECMCGDFDQAPREVPDDGPAAD